VVHVILSYRRQLQPTLN